MSRLRDRWMAGLALATLVGSLSWGAPAAAHRGLAGHRHDGRHHPEDEPSHERARNRRPSPQQIGKRLARIVRYAAKRKKDRAQRAQDRRRALRKRLWRLLRRQPLTAPMIAELRLHARRTARLRRIRLLAAKKRSYEQVVKVDKVLARENSRYERWLRNQHRAARAREDAAQRADAGAHR